MQMQDVMMVINIINTDIIICVSYQLLCNKFPIHLVVENDIYYFMVLVGQEPGPGPLLCLSQAAVRILAGLQRSQDSNGKGSTSMLTDVVAGGIQVHVIHWLEATPSALRCGPLHRAACSTAACFVRARVKKECC